MPSLFCTLRRYRNKSWARPVPAAAVIPAAQVMTDFIGPKAFVAGRASSSGNLPAQLVGVRRKLHGLGQGDSKGTSGVGVKSCNPGRTTDGESTSRELIRRSGTKAGVSNRIRYPGSPSCKRCSLGATQTTSLCCAVGKPRSEPPGKYVRKDET